MFNIKIVSSSLFYKIESNEAIITAQSIEAYNVDFFECNTLSNNYSIVASKELYMTNVFFMISSGARILNSEAASIARVHSTMLYKSRSEHALHLPRANIEVNNANFSRNKCSIVIALLDGPKNSKARFVSLIDNECKNNANLEAEVAYTAKNEYFQFIRNKCSHYLLTSYRADCYCDWFFFINNSITRCDHLDNGKFIFSNSFSTSVMTVGQGSTNGRVSVSPMQTELPFPAVMKRCPETKSTSRLRIAVTVIINFAFV